MSLLELIKLGITDLLHHKMRSFLTVLGVVFGVAAVISMLSIGEGAKRETLSKIEALGVNNISVEALVPDVEEDKPFPRILQLEDVDKVYTLSPIFKVVAPVKEIESTIHNITNGQEFEILGTTEAFFTINQLEVQRGGRVLTFTDEKYYRRVCVLGNRLAREIFKYKNPLEEMIKVGGAWFTVVGVLKATAAYEGEIAISNYNNNVYLPINTAIKVLASQEKPYIDKLLVQVRDSEAVTQAAQLLDDLMFRIHNNERHYTLVVPQRLLEQRQETLNTFNIVMGCIAGISLLVGGIGIMNIMLATVTERTREIGIRRAMGATRIDIIQQFFTETIMLSLFGGMVGVGVGYYLSQVITRFAEWSTIISPFSIIISLSVSVGIGIVFGTYPAIKAAFMDPIEALRHE